MMPYPTYNIYRESELKVEDEVHFRAGKERNWLPYLTCRRYPSTSTVFVRPEAQGLSVFVRLFWWVYLRGCLSMEGGLIRCVKKFSEKKIKNDHFTVIFSTVTTFSFKVQVQALRHHVPIQSMVTNGTKRTLVP